MAKLEVERVGGFAGFGGPGSRLRSRGSLDCATLSTTDMKALDVLFTNFPQERSPAPDSFIYRLTRQSPAGQQTIEVPEAHVPDMVKAVVKDELV